ncbi:hypothetical protein SDC9_198031 [bioreactor metagenome]|uniref:Uncharacterized protein n=1 Tax=bioreactor metagenome TaxID=1076179 RepID=A0A645IGJ5_9ZZZZ
MIAVIEPFYVGGRRYIYKNGANLILPVICEHIGTNGTVGDCVVQDLDIDREARFAPQYICMGDDGWQIVSYNSIVFNNDIAALNHDTSRTVIAELAIFDDSSGADSIERRNVVSFYDAQRLVERDIVKQRGIAERLVIVLIQLADLTLLGRIVSFGKRRNLSGSD